MNTKLFLKRFSRSGYALLMVLVVTAGSVLTSADLTQANLTGAPVYTSTPRDASDIIGKRLTRNLKTGEPFSTLIAPLRRYSTTGEVNFEVEDKDGMIKTLARTFSDGRVDFLDGITVEYADWWFNCRASNTEPLLRLTLEARTPQLKDEMYEKLVGILGEPSVH